jgi:hypothetical protein
LPLVGTNVAAETALPAITHMKRALRACQPRAFN